VKAMGNKEYGLNNSVATQARKRRKYKRKVAAKTTKSMACLRCGEKFKSEWKGNRLCPDCLRFSTITFIPDE